MKIGLTGFSGFVGTNIKLSLKNKYSFVDIDLRKFKDIKLDSDVSVVIHLAGLAHDINNSNNDNLYYEVNTNLTKKVFDLFLDSNADTFIYISSIKSVCDKSSIVIDESYICSPNSAYGKSKLLAEKYIISNGNSLNKRYFILRPSLIYGSYPKGNLALLFKFIQTGFPWPFYKFDNKRSYCYIENLFFVIDELITQHNLNSNIFNIADNDPLSTNELISLISEALGRKPKYLSIPPKLIKTLASIGDKFGLKFNSYILDKIVESYIVDNSKVIKILGKELPYSSIEGVRNTFKS